MTARYSLLDEPLLSVRRGADVIQRTLPEVFSALVRDEVDDFPALRPHQHHAWHAFLVQVAAMALHLDGRESLPDDPAVWRRLLVDLSDGVEEAWALLVADQRLPAFMQPPVMDGPLDKVLANEVGTPDELDLLITSKNHDLKGAVMRAPAAEQWALALVSLQTGEGFGGAGNYGVVRMNGGYGSRACVAFVGDMRWGPRVSRDVGVALEQRDHVADAHGYPLRAGHRLLWCLPWDGASALPLTSLDPYFVEVCRRVRLVEGPGEITARRTTTKKPRIFAADTKGRVGDLWTPIATSEGKSFSVSEAGFGYRKTHDLILSGDWALPPCAQRRPGGGVGELVLQGLARGQGQTNGYHERRIPVPPKATLSLFDPVARDRLAELSKERLEMVGTATHRVLKPAILAFMNGEVKDGGRHRDDRGQRWLTALDDAVDALFFPRLFADADRDPDEANREFLETLRSLASTQLEDAFRAAPTRQARRWQAIALAESVFRGAFRKKFAAYLGDPEPQSTTHE